jgi:DNA-binding MarR family transcriptional regulator/ribosomal protein S18 acetylase RimI-like enzyme
MARRQEIDAVRGFNRAVTESVGVLGARFLGRRRPPGESRLLWEIGPDGADVRELRSRLGLDSGYVTRLLHSLAREGLVRVEAGADDCRVRRARLTSKGRTERAVLDRRSNTLAAEILAPLNDRQRSTLVDAMSTVERLLRASMVRFAVENPRSADARWCIDQYFAELDARFEAGFDPALTISADARELTLPSGLLVVARLSGRAVGCGALKLHGKGPAELKRMWIAPDARGLGIGARLLRELEACASARGVRVVRLETNRTLREAIALYRRSGYVEVERFNDEPYAHHWFEKRVKATE